MKVLDLLAAPPDHGEVHRRRSSAAGSSPTTRRRRWSSGRRRCSRRPDGDLREVVRSIVTSRRVLRAGAPYRAKVKSPLEFAVSAVRATGGTVEPRPQGFVDRPACATCWRAPATIGFDAETLSAARMKTLNWHVFDMGQPLFACQPPTGYPEDSRKWVSSGALIARLNFAVAPERAAT